MFTIADLNEIVEAETKYVGSHTAQKQEGIQVKEGVTYFG